MLRTALGAHGRGQPVQLDLQGGCLNIRDHPRTWDLFKEFMGRWQGPEVSVVNGYLEGVPNLVIEGAVRMQRLRITVSEMPAGPTRWISFMVHGSLDLSDCELHAQHLPHSHGSMPGDSPAGTTLQRATSQSSSCSKARNAGSSVRAGNGSSGHELSSMELMHRPRLCALTARGSGARIHAQGCCFSGYTQLLAVLEGAQTQLEGCEADLSVELVREEPEMEPCVMVSHPRLRPLHWLSTPFLRTILATACTTACTACSAPLPDLVRSHTSCHASGMCSQPHGLSAGGWPRHPPAAVQNQPVSAVQGAPSDTRQ